MKKTLTLLNNRIIPAVAIICTTSLFASNSVAQPASVFKRQNCELSNTCALPGNNGERQVVINVTPDSGTDYTCEVKADEGLKFSVTGGKDFKITKGQSFYNANPVTNITISGKFNHASNPDSVGEIRFTKLSLDHHSQGTVICHPTKS